MHRDNQNAAMTTPGGGARDHVVVWPATVPGGAAFGGVGSVQQPAGTAPVSVAPAGAPVPTPVCAPRDGGGGGSARADAGVSLPVPLALGGALTNLLNACAARVTAPNFNQVRGLWLV